MPKFEPQSWQPQKAPSLEGDYAENSVLAGAQLWETGGLGPEDVAIADNGDVFTGLADGSILRFGRSGGGLCPEECRWLCL